MLVALTGSTGFVGRHVAATLLGRGHRVRALARELARGRARSLAEQGIEFVPGHLHDPAALEQLTRGTAAIIHLVGIIVEQGAATFHGVHVEGTRALLAAALEARVPRFVHMSAVGARDEPDATEYHRTKWHAEELVRGSRLSHAILRPSIISGPESAPIRLLARLHRWSPVIPVFGDGTFPTQPVWVGDVALAFALAAEQPDHVGAYELGGPQVLTYEEFVLAIGRASGYPRPLVHVPIGIVRAAAGVFDLLGPAAPLSSAQLQMLVEGSATPANAIQSVFGIEPLPFEDGLKRYLGSQGR
ncbi:MAG TPA: NAD-dependent epimerase/dehydratase family protein [Gemmatimonadales bacterium]|nr:NAD-dependent epimerase/dehydratase family protein [Gemmatimonadales bacterium]